jgi:hypothetical protein
MHGVTQPPLRDATRIASESFAVLVNLFSDRPRFWSDVERVGARLPAARTRLRLRIHAGPEALASRAAVTFPIRQVAVATERYPDARCQSTERTNNRSEHAGGLRVDSLHAGGDCSWNLVCIG